MTASDDIREAVRDRAADRCEYCLMHQALQGGTFHVEHIVPTSRGGKTQLDNLCWACPGCNLRKSDRVQVPDPESGGPVPLFDPRNDRWSDHFCRVEHDIEPLTATGRATIAALDLNHSRRVRIRRAEQMFGLFPPESE